MPDEDHNWRHLGKDQTLELPGAEDQDSACVGWRKAFIVEISGTELEGSKRLRDELAIS
jgi:hypothetical protein